VADDPGDRPEAGDRPDDSLADHRVLAHDRPFVIVERPFL